MVGIILPDTSLTVICFRSSFDIIDDTALHRMEKNNKCNSARNNMELIEL